MSICGGHVCVFVCVYTYYVHTDIHVHMHICRSLRLTSVFLDHFLIIDWGILSQLNTEVIDMVCMTSHRVHGIFWFWLSKAGDTRGPQWPLNIYLGGWSSNSGPYGTLVFTLYNSIQPISRTSWATWQTLLIELFSSAHQSLMTSNLVSMSNPLIILNFYCFTYFSLHSILKIPSYCSIGQSSLIFKSWIIFQMWTYHIFFFHSPPDELPLPLEHCEGCNVHMCGDFSLGSYFQSLPYLCL